MGIVITNTQQGAGETLSFRTLMWRIAHMQRLISSHQISHENELQT